MLIRVLSSFFRRRTDVVATNAKALEHYRRGELAQAEHYFREVARATPADPDALSNLAVALTRQRAHKAALPVLLKLIEVAPHHAEAQYELGLCYARLRRTDEGIPHYERAIALKPALHQAHAALATAYLDCCEWAKLDAWCADFLDYKAAHPASAWSRRIEPFTTLLLFPGEIATEVARQRAAEVVHSVSGWAPLQRASARAGGRLRVGYVSAELYNHPMGHLIRGLFEAHDRASVEVFVYSSGPDDESVYRRHIAATAEHFVDIRFETTEATARRVAADGIDVLVDLTGYTAYTRTQLFAARPAPIQVSYIGFPGTMGAHFIDYFISDHVASPPGSDAEFTEKLVRLAGTYLVTDDRQPIGEAVSARSAQGLPEDAFVYCSFNRLNKIDREIFSVWLDILREVPRAVLWLVSDEPQGERNLRMQARRGGVDDARIVFAPRVPKADHLARHRLADLFLDTTMYNAHTGTVDALWAGLPVLTCPGGTFARRVAASLVNALDVPELITGSLGDYRDAAIRFAREPARLAAVHAKVEQNRRRSSLFDTVGHARKLEGAYANMLDVHRSGKAAEAFAVEAAPAQR